jgi:hypothetical protein
MTLNFLIGVFITLAPIFGWVMILRNVQCSKLQLKEQQRSHHIMIWQATFSMWIMEYNKHQFVGFISSYTWFNVLTLFHLHSFVTFYTDSDSNTVVTCSLTTRHHILSNMLNHLIQLLQLMQFWKTESFSLSLTNTVISSDVKINQDSIYGYMGLDSDMSNFN